MEWKKIGKMIVIIRFSRAASASAAAAVLSADFNR